MIKVAVISLVVLGALSLAACGGAPSETTGSSEESARVCDDPPCSGGGGTSSSSSSSSGGATCSVPPNICLRNHTGNNWGTLNGATACGAALIANGCQGSFGGNSIGWMSYTADYSHNWYAVACPSWMAMPAACRQAPFNCDTGMASSDLQFCFDSQQASTIGYPPSGYHWVPVDPTGCHSGCGI